MKVKVKRKFRDRHTGVSHRRGEVLEITKTRYNEIMSVGDYVIKIAEDGAANPDTANNTNETEKAAEAAENAPVDEFDIMSVRELKEYADEVHKLTFGRGTKRAEIVETLRRLEHGK